MIRKMMFSEKITQEELLNNPEQFEGVKIATWYAMIKKGLKPLNWFVMESGTKISYKEMDSELEIENETRKLMEYNQIQYEKYNKRGMDNELAAMCSM